MLNMENRRVAPKENFFSKSASLDYRLQHVIGTFNEGWLEYYSCVCNALNIIFGESLSAYLEHKDSTRLYQSAKKSTLQYKRVRTYKWKAKVREALFREAVDKNAYASGVGFENYKPEPDPTAKNIKRKEISTDTVSTMDAEGKKRRKPRVPCNCGGSVQHYNKNSKHCMYKEKADELQPVP